MSGIFPKMRSSRHHRCSSYIVKLKLLLASLMLIRYIEYLQIAANLFRSTMVRFSRDRNISNNGVKAIARARLLL